MGGEGSTRWDYDSARRTVEECLSISMRWMTGRGYPRDQDRIYSIINCFDPATGGFRLAVTLDANLQGPNGWVRFRHQHYPSGESLDYGAYLTSTPMHFGGRRWWYDCPLSLNGRACRRRVGKLYLPPGASYFGCRRCHNLAYRSSRQAHAFDRLYASVAAQVGLPFSMVKQHCEHRLW